MKRSYTPSRASGAIRKKFKKSRKKLKNFMATTSVQVMGNGGSGYDPFASMLEHSINRSASKKSANMLAKIAFKYAQRYALEGPSWNVQGLRNAGLNPILAATNGQIDIPSMSGDITPSAAEGGVTVDPSAAEQDKHAKEREDLGVDLIKAQIDTIKKQGDAAMKNADNNQWQVVNARDEGYSDFRIMGIGAGGKIGSTSTLRINKVTGETYDALSGKQVKVLGHDASPATEPDVRLTPENAKPVKRYSSPSRTEWRGDPRDFH